MLVLRLLPPVLLLAALAGCGSQPERAPAIGEAFVGPVSTNLRQDLHPRSPTVATVKHGDRLEIINRRRRFFQVRTAQGAEGWTDARQLLSSQEMEKLNRSAEWAARLPSQGRATVYDPLNVHTEPNRQAPSFEQIPEKGSVEVIAHKLAPRVPYNSPILALATPGSAAPRRKPKRKKTDDILPPLPKPAPPGLPANWLELSKTPKSEEPEPEQEAPKPVPTAPMEDWSLVRTPAGKAGWVLTRMLIMAIPDEVAQYAEGHRITSYFSLGEVRDGEETKHIWLWTTLSRPVQPYQFDGFRVFVWSLRRHRYETAYIEREVEGYYPVTVEPAEADSAKRKAEIRGFSLILREKDGSLARRTYAFTGPRPRVISKTPWTPPPEDDLSSPRGGSVSPAPEAAREPGLATRLKEKLNSWRKGWFKR